MEERRTSALMVEKSQAELSALREDLTGQITRLRAEHEDKVKDLEHRLEVALGEGQRVWTKSGVVSYKRHTS